MKEEIREEYNQEDEEIFEWMESTDKKIEMLSNNMVIVRMLLEQIHEKSIKEIIKENNGETKDDEGNKRRIRAKPTTDQD